ncbi:PhzF family phenazine biosynthesis protein [Novosphingobium sp. Leaf2]|uniref:PhzF family phenazine biosynthesis protein n=1 Tax=Novosphingobium sp. Leaf2 TaxID=1735670 RepID=UPI000700E5D0|nr:PhzF family phenazine biosynthesis protein [Novosphingobium sp. Leaf2]KQM18778.1 phenazine biosynthesis protein PhzF [Novosphingobium sp. Leaf2]
MLLDLIDVFGSGVMNGNPLAVVRGAENLDPSAMLLLTRWLGFSETTFLLPPNDSDADYRVRIFYPGGELPFAGHPTLGTACAWLAAGGIPRRPGVVVQECGIGLVDVRTDDDKLAFRAPPLIRSGPLNDRERAQVIALTGASPEQVVAAVHASNGPDWKLLHLDSADAVLAAEPATHGPKGADVALLGTYPPGSTAQYAVRAFFVDGNGRLCEDPVTGSLNAAIAQYLFASGQASCAYVAAQGCKVGADGMVYCSQSADGAVWVAGRVTVVSSGGTLSRAE